MYVQVKMSLRLMRFLGLHLFRKLYNCLAGNASRMLSFMFSRFHRLFFFIINRVKNDCIQNPLVETLLDTVRNLSARQVDYRAFYPYSCQPLFRFPPTTGCEPLVHTGIFMTHAHARTIIVSRFRAGFTSVFFGL